MWVIAMACVAVALVLLVVLDVRRRARIDPMPEAGGAAAPAAPFDDPAASSHPSASKRYPFGRTKSGHRTDLTAYTAAARVLDLGGTADEAYEARSPRGWRYQYPPLLAALMIPLSRFHTATQAVLFGLITAVLVLLLISEGRAWWRIMAAPGDERSVPLPAFIAVFAIAAAALPVLNTLQRGQVGLLVVWPLMVGFRLLWTARSPLGGALGGALLAFPAVLKVIPFMPALSALLLTAAALPRGRRTAVGVSGFIAGLLLAGLLIPIAMIGWTRTIDATAIFASRVASNPDFATDWDFDIHSNRNQSLDSAAWKVVLWTRGETSAWADPLDLSEEDRPPPPRPIAFDRASTVVRALLAAFALVAALRAARRGVRGAFAGFGLMCLATLVVSPVSWGHHFVMLVPAMIAVPAWLESRGRSMAAFAFSALMAAAVILHYAAVDLAGRGGVLGLASAALLVAGGAALWRDRTPPRRPARSDSPLRAVRSNTLPLAA